MIGSEIANQVKKIVKYFFTNLKSIALEPYLSNSLIADEKFMLVKHETKTSTLQ